MAGAVYFVYRQWYASDHPGGCSCHGKAHLCLFEKVASDSTGQDDEKLEGIGTIQTWTGE